MCKIVFVCNYLCVLTPSLLIVHPTMLFVVFSLLFVSREATSSSSVTDWLGGGRTTTESGGRVCGAVGQFPPVHGLSTRLRERYCCKCTMVRVILKSLSTLYCCHFLKLNAVRLDSQSVECVFGKAYKQAKLPPN